MHDIIEILCNGDFHGRNLARRYFTFADLEELAQKNEKAAATNSDQFQ